MVQEKGRRQRYRGRDTISRMLQDGEKHQVWKPGRRDSSKHKITESPDQRQQSLFKRINTYRTTSKEDVADVLVCGGVVGVMASVQRRMEQWQKIEDEVRRAEEREAVQSPLVGGMAEGRVQEFDMSERRESITRRGSVLSQAMVTIAEEEEGGRGRGRGGRKSKGGEGRKRKGGLVREEEAVRDGEEGEEMGDTGLDGGKALPLATLTPEVGQSGAPSLQATTGYKDTEL